MIKKIHQTWKDEHPPTSKFRSEWVDSWAELNPGWEYRLWTDEDINKFVGEFYPDFYPVWCSYPKNIMRVDAWRYLLLLKTGGLYVDLDVACLRPVEQWLTPYERFSCPDQGDGKLSNAFMWAPEKESSFLAEIEVALCATAYERDPLLATGPDFLTRYSRDRRDLLSQIEMREAFPITVWERDPMPALRNDSITSLREKFPEAFTISLWTGSWTDQPNSIVGLDITGLKKSPTQVGGKRIFVAVSKTGSDEQNFRKRVAKSGERIHFNYYERISCGGQRLNSIEPFDGLVSDLNKIIPDFLKSDSEWLFVISDQTIFVIERVMSLIGEDEVDFICNESLIVSGIPSARAGYLISRSLAASLMRDNSAKDEFLLVKYLSEKGVSIDLTTYLRQDRFRYPTADNYIVSTATDDYKYFELFDIHTSSKPSFGIRCAHRGWHGTLTFLDGNRCIRPASGCGGSWIELEGAHRLIRWFDWEPEIMLRIDEISGYVTSLDNISYLIGLDICP